jgi:uncharacterized linocin/CFP29 family protein
MNNLHRHLAPISAEAWEQIEQEASRTLKLHLGGAPGFLDRLLEPFQLSR